MSPCQDILKELDARRVELGMSIAALARHAGLGKATVQRALRGKGTDSITTLWAIARAVGVDIDCARPRKITAVRRQQATAKAEQVVRLTAGNAALENRRIDAQKAKELERTTRDEFLHESAFVLWA